MGHSVAFLGMHARGATGEGAILMIITARYRWGCNIGIRMLIWRPPVDDRLDEDSQSHWTNAYAGYSTTAMNSCLLYR